MSDATNVEEILRNSRGLDLTDVEATSDREQRAFQDYYEKFIGRRHRGLDFWLQERPDVLKRYRRFAETPRPGGMQTDWRVLSFSFYTLYALTGYSVGIRYLVHINQQQGLLREQILDGLGIVFIHCGPRGMETIAEALDGYPWVTPKRPVEFPDGWAFDQEAFRSGLDFSTPTLTPNELRSLERWYERWTGEVPRYVRFLARHRPELLKSHRDRYENLLRVLPKQVLPMTLLSYEAMRGFSEGIRENVLLAKGFGVARADVLAEIDGTLINAGPEAIEVVDRAVGDVLEQWA